MGFRLLRWDNGEADVAYEPRPEHLNSFSVVHGGASMTLLDVAMASAARSVQQDMGAVTVEMKTSFLQAAQAFQGALQARAKLLHRTATLAFVEGRVLDSQGRCCAHATGTFKYVPRLPVGRRASRAFNAMGSD